MAGALGQHGIRVGGVSVVVDVVAGADGVEAVVEVHDVRGGGGGGRVSLCAQERLA